MDPEILKELLAEFITETSEGLDALEKDLLSFEAGEAEENAINRVFRIIHTIKGSSGSLALNKMERVSHEGEQLLDKVRSDKIDLTSEMVTPLLELLDVLRVHLVSLQDNGVESDNENSDLIASLKSVYDSLFQSNPVEVHLDEEDDDELENEISFQEENAVGELEKTGTTDAFSEEGESWGVFDDSDAQNRNDSPVEKASDSGEGESWGLFSSEDVVPTDVDKENPTVLETVLGEADTSHSPVEFEKSGENVSTPKVSSDKKTSSSDISETTIRVEIKQLDTLMSLVGELVLTRNQILQQVENLGGQTIHQSYLHLDHITSELQQSMMQTRMQPIGNAWTKLPRIVRDLAKAMGKNVRLEMEGKDTELDRSLIEAIKDPLLHLVRNSVDHGIESPEERLSSGKDQQGVLCLSAYHESGQVHIDIIDDGHGINVEKIKAKALESGIITEEVLGRMNERDIIKLIFQPGFSTAEEVSNVSGRGVGMDVVRSNIEKIGGSIDIQTELGQGTSLKIKIPLTLAIIPAVIVGAGEDRFAIPQLSLQELVMLEGAEIEQKIETLYDSKIYRLRGEIIPIVFLNELLGIECEKEDVDLEDQTMNIVVLQAEGLPFGLVVDKVFDTEEIVVKPLSKQLKKLRCYSGATIMGDGRVALILDAHGIGHYSNALGHNRRDDDIEDDQEVGEDYRETSTMLLFNVGEDSRMAVPLADVDRVEEIEASRIERVRGTTIVQHRGRILKLIDLSRVIPGMTSLEKQKDDALNVIVYTKEGRSVGIIVSEVLDVVNEVIEVQESSNVDCLLGSLPLDGKVTEILDLDRLTVMADPFLNQEKVVNHG